MKISKASLTRIIILGCIFPIIMSFIVYKGFSTDYNVGVFSKQGFEEQYGNGIYKYRVLGRIILLKTYDLVIQNKLPTIPQANADSQFYSAYFYMNTLFLCLTCVTLFFILGGPADPNFMNVDLPLLFMCSLMTVTQYIIVPYDTLSYFFLSVAVLIIFEPHQSKWNTLAICFVVVLATLTRETATLILAFYFAYKFKHIWKKPRFFKINREQWTIVFIVVSFLVTYFGLRLILGIESAVFESITLFYNANYFSVLSILFILSIVILVLITKEVTKEIIVFLIASTPYTLPLVVISRLWEIRLWTPVIILLLILKIRDSTDSGILGMNKEGNLEEIEA